MCSAIAGYLVVLHRLGGAGDGRALYALKRPPGSRRPAAQIGLPRLEERELRLLLGWRRRLSHTSGRDVAVHVALGPDEHDAVSGRVSLVPFHLLIRNGDPGSRLQHALAVS